MRKYTFSISKPGYEVTDPDPSHKLLDADYPFFKFHSDNTGSITFAPGDTNAYADITHNLGYTPAFIGYIQDFDDATKLRFISTTPPAVSGVAPWSYVDSTKIRVGMSLINSTYNESAQNWEDLWSTVFGTNSSLTVGHLVWQETDYGSSSGAARFTNVTIPQGSNIINALLKVYVGIKGAGAGDLKAIIYGIDEDNTSGFGDPMGRPRTSASDTANWSLPPVGQYSNHDVTSMVQEIVNRAGWASGNAMGFLILDNSSPYDVWVYDSSASNPTSRLEVTYGDNRSRTFRVIIFKDKIA